MSAQRPPSVRSVTSNSSLASTVSLSRRPRIRGRSRTVTGSPSLPTDDPLPALPSVPGPILPGPLVQEPMEETSSPMRPPRSPHRLATETTTGMDPPMEETLRGSNTTPSRGVEGSTFLVEPIQFTGISASTPQSKASSLPHRLGPPVETLRGSDTTSSHSVEGSTFVVEPTQSSAISQPSKHASSLPASTVPYVPATLVQRPIDDISLSPYLPKSPLSLAVEITHGSDTTSSRGVEGSTFVIEPTQSSAISQSKASKHASSLPHLDTTPRYKPPPSAFSRDPALTPGKNVRDSLSTEQSGMSSSLYPPSTSSASGPISPVSLSPQNQLDAPSIVLDTQEYDGDDVAYRLRLLVQNSYFLPPAHSKPSPADFAPAQQQQQQQKKTNSPTFLDIFRVGKSRSKPTTPTGTGPILPPMLRTTGDSITPAFSDQPRTAPRIQAPTARGRVVVVREKMLDIATAAKQAEQEVKARGARADATGSQLGTPTVDDDDIDPTDAVDIPLPPPSYPFAVQASALHGLGVADSVGAAVLADLLPPSQNPTLAREYDAAEDSWRKHLLREAVGHSLDNTPDASMSIFSQPLSGGATSPVPKASKSLDVEGRGSLSPSQIQAQAQTRQGQAQANAHLIARKITDSLPPTTSTPPPRPSTSPGTRSPINNNGNGNNATASTNISIHTHPPAPLRPSGESHGSGSVPGRPSTNSNRISTKRNLGLPPAVVAEIEMLEGLSLSMPRPGSTLPPRADTPVEPQTPLGPPPRPPRVAQAMSGESGPGGLSGGAGGEKEKEKEEQMEARGGDKWRRDNSDNGPDHSALRRTVSSPSLTEEYESAVSRRASTPPPLPVYSTATPAGTRTRTKTTAEYRLSQATVTSFDGTHNGDVDDNDHRDYDASRSQLEIESGTHLSSRSRRSLSDAHESDYYEQDSAQTPGRVSLALSAFPAPSMRTRSPSGSRSREQSQSRPSLSVSEYSQASLSPTTSAFQEMLNHDDHSQDYTYTHTPVHTHRTRGSSSAPPSAAPTPEPGASSMGIYAANADDQQQEQEQRYATYIDAARIEAMSPPPRNSSSLAFEALPAPPRSTSLAFSHSNGSNSAPRSFNLSSSAKPQLHSSYAPPPRSRPGTGPTPGPGPSQTHIGRSYSQPPVRRYPFAFASTSTSLPTTITTTNTTATASEQLVFGPAPLAITLEILAPEPTTPPLPPNTSFGDDATIPALSSSAPRSGTGPASFFDSIQSHMDDLDSSEDEDDDDDDEDDLHSRHRILPPFATSAFGGGSPGRPRTASVAADSSPHRPMMMKHANFSAPYIRSSAGAGAGEGQSQSPQSPRLGSDSGHGHASGHGHISSKNAVGNVAVKPKPVQPALAASSDFFKYTQEHPTAALPSSSSVGTGAGALGASVAYRGSAPNLNAKAQESLRRFDGMLQQHIDSEKDTLKRIATTLKQQQQTASASASPRLNGATYSMQDLKLPGRR